jgi:WD40 repeat protein
MFIRCRIVATVLLVLAMVAGCTEREPTDTPAATLVLPTATDAPIPPTNTSVSEGAAALPEAMPTTTPLPKVSSTPIPLSETALPLDEGDGRAMVLAPENLQSLERLYTLSGYATAFHPRESLIATGELAGKIKMWSLADGSLLRELTDLHGMVFDLDFSSNGNLLAAAFGANAAVIDATSGASLSIFDGLGRFIQSVAFSPDDTLLAIGGSDGISVVDTTNWEKITELHGHEGGIFDLDFTPDGKLLVSAGGIPDSRVIVWNVETLQIEHTLEGHGGDVHSLALSPDSRFVVSGGTDRRVFLWDLSTGAFLRGLSGYRDVVYGLAYSPAGTLVAAGCGADGYVMFWNIEDTQAPFKLADRGTEVRRVEFSPDGYFLAESNTQHEVVIWGFSQD